MPGVLFCNRPVETESPRLMDIGPTVLDMFGVAVPSTWTANHLTVVDAADGDPSQQGNRSVTGRMYRERLCAQIQSQSHVEKVGRRCGRLCRRIRVPARTGWAEENGLRRVAGRR